jgi:hypothetical protein
MISCLPELAEDLGNDIFDMKHIIPQGFNGF